VEISKNICFDSLLINYSSALLQHCIVTVKTIASFFPQDFETNPVRVTGDFEIFSANAFIG